MLLNVTEVTYQVDARKYKEENIETQFFLQQ